MDLDTALCELDEDQPKVIVEPEIGAFCMVRARSARGTTPPERTSGRLPLEAILAYIANPF
jgi:hypothetical protein